MDDGLAGGNFQWLLASVEPAEEPPHTAVVLAYLSVEGPDDVDDVGAQMQQLLDGLGSSGGQKNGESGPRDDDVGAGADEDGDGLDVAEFLAPFGIADDLKALNMLQLEEPRKIVSSAVVRRDDNDDVSVADVASIVPRSMAAREDGVEGLLEDRVVRRSEKHLRLDVLHVAVGLLASVKGALKVVGRGEGVVVPEAHDLCAEDRRGQANMEEIVGIGFEELGNVNQDLRRQTGEGVHPEVLGQRHDEDDDDVDDVDDVDNVDDVENVDDVDDVENVDVGDFEELRARPICSWFGLRMNNGNASFNK